MTRSRDIKNNFSTSHARSSIVTHAARVAVVHIQSGYSWCFLLYKDLETLQGAELVAVDPYRVDYPSK